jgi:hypothetical protein
MSRNNAHTVLYNSGRCKDMQEKETNMTDINIYSGTPEARPHADVGEEIAERLK